MPTIHKLGYGLHNHLMIHVRKNVLKEEILVGIIIDFRMMNTLGCQLKIRITNYSNCCLTAVGVGQRALSLRPHGEGPPPHSWLRGG
jgi:hypothetical protein